VPNKLRLVLKINFLVLALILVTAVIFSMNKSGIGSHLKDLLGLDNQESLGQEAIFDWCKFPLKKAELLEQNLNLTEGEALTQWQKRYCRLPVTWTDPVALSKNTEALILHFKADRPPIVFSFSKAGPFTWSKRGFTSPQLRKAIQRLQNILRDAEG